MLPVDKNLVPVDEQMLENEDLESRYRVYEDEMKFEEKAEFQVAFSSFRQVFEGLSPKLLKYFCECPGSTSPVDGTDHELRVRVTEMIVRWNLSRSYVCELEYSKRCREWTEDKWTQAVSYTHLTLPTIYSV